MIQKTIEPYTTELKKYLKASTLCCEISRLVEDKHVDAEKRSIDSNLRTLLRQLSLLCKYLHTHVLSIPNEKLEDLIKKLEAIRFLNNSVNNDLIQPLTESISNLQLLLCEIADSIAQVQGQTMTYSINNNPSMSLQDLKNQVPIDLLLKLIYNSLTRQAQSYITAYTTKTLNLISSRKTKREEKTRLVEKEKEKERRPALEETRFREKLKQMNRQHDFYSTTKDATTSKGKADNTTFWNETYSKIVNLLNKMNPDHLSPEEKSYFSDFMDFNFYQTLDHMQKFKTLMRNLYLKNNGSLEMNDWDELSKLIDEWAKDWNVNAMVSFMEVTLTS